MFLKNIVIIAVIAFGIFSTETALSKTSRLSDDQVKQKIIDESIAAYPGTCACPFNSARNGSRCGGRSAWSRAGGYSPLCYKNEVTQKMVDAWRRNNNI